MKKETPFRRIFGVALLGLLGLAFWNCEDSPTGPGEPTDEPPNPYKGRWLPVKIADTTYWPGNDITPARWDTTDRTEIFKYWEIRDSSWYHVYTIRETDVYDTVKYYFTADSLCSSTYGGNYLDWECGPHAFKGPDTIDFSNARHTEIWARAN